MVAEIGGKERQNKNELQVTDYKHDFRHEIKTISAQYTYLLKWYVNKMLIRC